MQVSLRTRVTDDCCIFGDIMDIYQCGGQEAHDHIAAGSDYYCRKQRAEELPRTSHGWCLQHQRLCPFATDSSIRVGGFPCQDHSTAGKQLGADGPRLPVTLAFGHKANDTRNNLLCVENVASCPTELVHDVFGNPFEWCAERTFSPSDVGFDCINRPRPILYENLEDTHWEMSTRLPPSLVKVKPCKFQAHVPWAGFTWEPSTRRPQIASTTRCTCSSMCSMS